MNKKISFKCGEVYCAVPNSGNFFRILDIRHPPTDLFIFFLKNSTAGKVWKHTQHSKHICLLICFLNDWTLQNVNETYEYTKPYAQYQTTSREALQLHFVISNVDASQWNLICLWLVVLQMMFLHTTWLQEKNLILSAKTLKPRFSNNKLISGGRKQSENICFLDSLVLRARWFFQNISDLKPCSCVMERNTLVDIVGHQIILRKI